MSKLTRPAAASTRSSHRQQQHGPGADQPVPHRSPRLPEPVRGGAQHRRAATGLRLVPGRRAGRAGRHLPSQVVHRGRHPPERRAVRDASADGLHGRLDRPDSWPRTFATRVSRRSSATATTGRNYIAVDDVAEFAVKILARRDRQRGRRSRRAVQRVAELPGVARRAPPEVVRQAPARAGRGDAAAAAIRPPFNEVAARLMTLGLYAATEAQPFPGWQASADRFGVAPRTVETYVDQMPR